jgi:hypothetical protein
MATITLNEKTYPVRPLTRGEIKRLRQSGLYITQINGTDNQDMAEAAIDAVLDMVVGEKAVENLPNPDANRLYIAIIEATYGSVAAEKNSLRSGTGTATRSAENTATPAARPPH